MPANNVITRKIRNVSSVKDKLRDDLDDIKILVRRSFGAIVTELADLEVALVEGCSVIQEECVLQRVLGSTAAASSRRNSIHGVFQAIDIMHRSMEEAGIRRKRLNGVSNPTQKADSPSVSNSLLNETSGITSSIVEDILLEVGAESDEIIVRSAAPADSKGSTLTQDALSNRRTAAFSAEDVFSISPYALEQACQLRLATLTSIRDEVFTGAMQAQRKLVAARRWVPDAPCPLAASVEGLICEIQAMKKQLLVDSPSMSMASLPMVQYPLASINIKQMKHHMQQQQQRTGSPPRQSTSPRPLPSSVSPLLDSNSILHASRTGTALVEGAHAQAMFAERVQTQQRRVKKVLSDSMSLHSRRGLVPVSSIPMSPPDANGTEHLQISSDDVQRLLRSVKAELQKQPNQQGETISTFVPTKFGASPLCKTPNRTRMATPQVSSPTPTKISRGATPVTAQGSAQRPSPLPPRLLSRGSAVTSPLSNLSLPLGQLQQATLSLQTSPSPQTSFL